MSSAGRICPQCSYERQPKDLAPDYECPRCGIIYHKYRPPVTKSPAPGNILSAGGASAGRARPATMKEKVPQEGSPEAGAAPEDEAWELKPASPLRRALAAVYTGSLVLLYFVPLKIVVYVSIRIVFPPRSLTPSTLSTIHAWEAAYYFFLVLMVIYAFFLRPLAEGATWGQDRFGISVRPADGQERALTLNETLLRFAGNLLAFLFSSITVPIHLYFWYKKRDFPGIADRISNTRQYETGEPVLKFRAAVGTAFRPACIALILQLLVIGPICSWIMSGYMEEINRQMRRAMAGFQPSWQGADESSTPQQNRRPPAEIGAEMRARQAEHRVMIVRQESLALLIGLEQRYRTAHGSYTGDLAALVAEYASDLVDSDEILKLIQKDAIRARNTARGVEIWVEATPGNWKWRELH